MKNGRAIRNHDAIVKQHQLSISPPAPGSLFWQLWNGCLDLAEQALESNFVQGIKGGNLNPLFYGVFKTNDLYFCVHGADAYLAASHRARHGVLADWLMAKQDGYEDYNAELLKFWNLANSHAVLPTPLTREYSKFEAQLANGARPGCEDAIYSLIGLLPNEYLWVWLAEQLTPYLSKHVYAHWIAANSNPDWAYAMGNYLEDYCREFAMDVDMAVDVYRTAMAFEVENFCQFNLMH